LDGVDQEAGVGGAGADLAENVPVLEFGVGPLAWCAQVLAALAPTLDQAMQIAAAKAYVTLDGTLLRIDRVAMASGREAGAGARGGGLALEGKRPGVRFEGRHPLDPSHVRRDFRNAIKAAKGVNAADWTPRELRHSFVSLLSDSGVPLEEISRLVGYSSTAVTELVYRKQIRPVMQVGAVTMDRVFPA
jgi:hypothetical protein